MASKHGDKVTMSTSSDTVNADVVRWVSHLERISCEQGLQKPAAREAVAKKLGVPVGTLENIVRGRTKGVRAWIVERVKGLMAHELEKQIQRLEHELLVVNSYRSGDVDEAEVSDVIEAVTRAKALVRKLRACDESTRSEYTTSAVN